MAKRGRPAKPKPTARRGRGRPFEHPANVLLDAVGVAAMLFMEMKKGKSRQEAFRSLRRRDPTFPQSERALSRLLKQHRQWTSQDYADAERERVIEANPWLEDLPENEVQEGLAAHYVDDSNLVRPPIYFTFFGRLLRRA